MHPIPAHGIGPGFLQIRCIRKVPYSRTLIEEHDKFHNGLVFLRLTLTLKFTIANFGISYEILLDNLIIEKMIEIHKCLSINK